MALAATDENILLLLDLAEKHGKQIHQNYSTLIEIQKTLQSISVILGIIAIERIDQGLSSTPDQQRLLENVRDVISGEKKVAEIILQK